MPELNGRYDPIVVDAIMPPDQIKQFLKLKDLGSKGSWKYQAFGSRNVSVPLWYAKYWSSAASEPIYGLFWAQIWTTIAWHACLHNFLKGHQIALDQRALLGNIADIGGGDGLKDLDEVHKLAIRRARQTFHLYMIGTIGSWRGILPKTIKLGKDYGGFLVNAWAQIVSQARNKGRIADHNVTFNADANKNVSKVLKSGLPDYDGGNWYINTKGALEGFFSLANELELYVARTAETKLIDTWIDDLSTSEDTDASNAVLIVLRNEGDSINVHCFFPTRLNNWPERGFLNIVQNQFGAGAIMRTGSADAVKNSTTKYTINGNSSVLSAYLITKKGITTNISAPRPSGGKADLLEELDNDTVRTDISESDFDEAYLGEENLNFIE